MATKAKVMFSDFSAIVSRRLLLVLTLLTVSHGVQAIPPPPPTNVRSILTPAEIVFTWDPAPGAAYYRVLHADSSRRWIPLAQLTGTQVRDPDFPSLPCYYEIHAFNADGEVAPSVNYI